MTIKKKSSTPKPPPDLNPHDVDPNDVEARRLGDFVPHDDFSAALQAQVRF